MVSFRSARVKLNPLHRKVGSKNLIKIVVRSVITWLVPLDETHLDAVRGLIQTKRFRPSASTKKAQLSVAATTVRSTDLFNIMSSPESMLIRQD